MFFQPSRNGNMPAVREPARPIHGETQLPVRMRIIIGMVIPTVVMILSRLAMLGSMRRTHGAFLICTEMYGNGSDWFQAAYPTGNPVVDPTGPASGSRLVERGGSWYHGGPHLRSKSVTTTPPVSAAASLASVLVSKNPVRERKIEG